MALQGYTELQFSYDKFKHIDFSSGKKKNSIAPLVQNAIGAGNFHSMMEQGKIMPLLQWFNGCQLFDKEHANALSTSMMDYDANVVACAGSGTNAGDLANNTKLGVFQSEPSGMTADGKGYQFVWEWGTAYGNGDIKSVCLTRDELAIADLVRADETSRSVTLPPYVSLGTMTGGDVSSCQIIDYAKGRAYKIGKQPTASELTIEEYDVSTNYLKVNGSAGSFIRKIGDTHTYSGLTGLVQNQCSANYTGTAIRIIWFSGSTISEVTIPTDTWTMSSITTHTYSEASFRPLGNYIKKDKIPLKGNYVYLQSGDYTKIYKCNLASTEIEAIDNPLYTLGIQSSELGSSVLLPNGDILWQSTYNQAYGLLLHNDIWYAVRLGMNVASGSEYAGLSGNDYGTVISTQTAHSRLITPYGYVSTVNNLGQTYTKNSSMSMRLIYTIREV